MQRGVAIPPVGADGGQEACLQAAGRQMKEALLVRGEAQRPERLAKVLADRGAEGGISSEAEEERRRHTRSPFVGAYRAKRGVTAAERLLANASVVHEKAESIRHAADVFLQWLTYSGCYQQGAAAREGAYADELIVKVV